MMKEVEDCPREDVEMAGSSPPVSSLSFTLNWILLAIGVVMLGGTVRDLSSSFILSSGHDSNPRDHRGRRMHVPDTSYTSYITREDQINHWWSKIKHLPPGKLEGLPNILFVKPHKVGSTSMSSFVRLVAARNGGIPREYMYKANNSAEHFYARKELQPLEEGVHIWADHESLSSLLENVQSEIIDASFKFTLVRDPLDRCFSAFYYYTRVHVDTITEEELTRRQLEFEFCGLVEEQANQIGEIGPKGMNSSVEETVAFFDLIGVTSRYMETLTVIKMLLGLRYGDMLFFNRKFHPSKRRRVYEEPPEVIQHMKALIASEDWDLFSAAKWRLNKTIEMLEPEFSAAHEKLVEITEQAFSQCGNSDHKDTGYPLPDGFGCSVRAAVVYRA
ncbi:unnamed protein product [Discosporangium mesarthrocarpum]